MATYNIDYNIYLDNGVLQRWDNNQKAYVEITDSNITDHLYYSNGHWVMTGLDITISKATAITVKKGDATISVIGTNSITASPGTSVLSSSGIASSDSNVTLQGSGELSITAGDVQNSGSVGIWMSGTLTLKESVTVTAKGGNSLSMHSYGVQVTQLSVSDTASLTATAGSGATEAAYMLANDPSSSAPTDAVTSTDLALNPVTFDTNKKTYVDEVGNAITSLTIQAYDDRVVVTPATGTKENPQDLGADKTITVKSGTANGGALEVQAGAYATATNLTYASNSVTGADAKGGAIYNDGELSLNGGTFSGNSAAQGGAVYNAGKLLMSGDITLSTSSDTVYNEGTMLWNLGNGVNYQSKVVNYEYVTNATEENPVTGEMNPVGKMAIVVSGETQGYGTYVLATGNLSDAMDDDTGKYEFYLTDDGETFSGNLDLGGTVWFSDHTYTLTVVNDNTLRLVVAAGDHPHMTVSSATCPESEGLFTITLDIDGESVTTYAGDGGVFTVEATGTLKNESGVTIKKVKAAGNGGAISSVGKLDLNDITFEENYSSSANGGAISITGGTENTIKNATFGGNAIGDVSSSTGGGAIYMENATLTLDNVLFTTNSSSELGGAIYAKNSTLNISGDTAFNSNGAYRGGAIDADTTTLNLTDVSFKENTAENGGGAIIASHTSVVTLDGVSFDSNNGGTEGGGAICLYDSAQIKLTGSVTLATSTDTILFTWPSQNMTWVISDTDSKKGYLNDYSLIEHNSAITSFTKDNFTIDAEDALQESYILAGNASSADGQEFTITTADGSNQIITVNGSTVTDATYGTKYTLAVNTAYDLVLSVEKADVTLAVYSQERTYDGTTNLVDTEAYQFTGLAAGFTGSATLTNSESNVGTYTGAIDATDITIKNGQDDVTKYYNVTTNKGNLTINKREVTVTGTTADEKMYDGTTDATVHLGTVGNTIEGDDITVTAAGEFDNKNAGNGKTVTITYTLSGDDAGNYTVDSGDTTADITPRDVTLTSESASKKYDGTALTNGNVTETGSGFITGEGATYTVTGTQTDAGSSANAFTYDLTGGTLAQNYDITMVEGTLTVTPRDVVLTSGSATKVYDGTALTNDTVTVSGSGFVGTDGATYTVTGTQTKAGTSANTFSYTLNDGTKADNYEITTVEGTLTVTQKRLSIDGTTVDNKKYDGTTDATVHAGTLSGMLEGDEVTLSAEGSFITSHAGAHRTVTVLYTLEGADSANYETIVAESISADIEQRQVTVTSGSSKKVFDGTPLTNGRVTVSGDGFVEGEGAIYNVTGSQTLPGSSENTFTCTLDENTLYTDYDITKEQGTLTVLPPELSELTVAGNFNGEGSAFQLMTDGTAVIRTTEARTELAGTLENVEKWKIIGTGNFDGNEDGREGLLWQDLTTGELVIQNNMTSFAEVNNKTSLLGIVENGYTAKATGDFSGNGVAGALIQCPETGDIEVSTSRGLACFDTGSEGWFTGWLGALVNTWDDGVALKGDLSDLVSLNQNNYRYEVAAVGDFNGDGRDDVMIQNTMPEVVTQEDVDYEITGSGDVFVFLTGSEEAIKRGDNPTVCYAGCATDGWTVLGVGDFNADGIDDTLLSNGTDLAGWSMVNGQRQSDFTFGSLTSNEQFAGIADFNNDGTDDLLIRTLSTGDLNAWTIENGKVTGTLAIV